MNNIVIGIDPGVNVGYAIWNRVKKEITEAKTLTFWETIKELEWFKFEFTAVIEDVTQNKPTFQRSGQNTNAMLKISQNVGSNKRDCQLIIEWLELHHIEIVKVKPNTAKWNDNYCKQITKYMGSTSQHARDAIKLVYGL